MSNSYNGWPGIPSSSDPRLAVIDVAGRKFRVRAGDVATVFQRLIERFHNEVEAIDQGVLDDWSYNYRAVTGGSSLSNHASGTAVDLNATRHPYNTKATANFSGAQIAAIRSILADFNRDGEVIRWLDGHDPMHFEINYINRGGTVENVAQLARRIRGEEAAPVPPTAAPRGPRPIDWTNPDDALVRITQEIVGVKADGVRGPKTREATKAHQRALGMANPDTLFGPAHAEAYLLSVPNLYRSKPDAEMPAPAVKLVQWIGGVNPDGSFGEGTEQAVKGLQVWAGLFPDGNVGNDTKIRITV